MNELTPEEIDEVFAQWNKETQGGVSKEIGNTFSQAVSKATVAKLLSSIPDDGKLREEIAHELIMNVLEGFDTNGKHHHIVLTVESGGEVTNQIINLVNLRLLNKIEGLKVLKIDLESISHPTSTNMSGISISRKEWEEFWAEQLKENR